MALWHYLEFLAGVNPRTNALAVSIYSYINIRKVHLVFVHFQPTRDQCLIAVDLTAPLIGNEGTIIIKDCSGNVLQKLLRSS